jgi:hypothetical protein
VIVLTVSSSVDCAPTAASTTVGIGGALLLIPLQAERNIEKTMVYKYLFSTILKLYGE